MNKNNMNNTNASVSASKRNRHEDAVKATMMANDIAVTRVTSETLHTYQDKHAKMLYDTTINLMDAPNHNANDTFTVDGKLYNFTTSGYEAVLKSFDTIRRKLEEAQTASEKLPGMESAYAGLISEVLGVNLEDATNVDAANDVEEDNNMKKKYKYIVIDTSKGPDANTAEEIRNAFRIYNMHAFDIEICDAGHRSRRIGVVTTGHNKALKIVLDYLGGGMPSFREFYETGVTYDLGFGRRWCVGDICITSDEGVFNRLTETILIDKDCGPTKLSASEPGHLTPLLDEEKHCCNNCDDKEICQSCVDAPPEDSNKRKHADISSLSEELQMLAARLDNFESNAGKRDKLALDVVKLYERIQIIEGRIGELEDIGERVPDLDEEIGDIYRRINTLEERAKPPINIPAEACDPNKLMKLSGIHQDCTDTTAANAEDGCKIPTEMESIDIPEILDADVQTGDIMALDTNDITAVHTGDIKVGRIGHNINIKIGGNVVINDDNDVK